MSYDTSPVNSRINIDQNYSTQQLEKFQHHPKLYVLRAVIKNREKRLEAHFVLNPITLIRRFFQTDSFKLKTVVTLISEMNFKNTSPALLADLTTILLEKVARHNLKKPNDIPEDSLKSLKVAEKNPSLPAVKKPKNPPPLLESTHQIEKKLTPPPSPEDKRLTRIVVKWSYRSENLDEIRKDAEKIMKDEASLKRGLQTMLSGSKTPPREYERVLDNDCISQVKSSPLSMLKYLVLTDQIGFFQLGRTDYLFGIDPKITEGRPDENIGGRLLGWHCCINKERLLKLDEKIEEYRQKFLSIINAEDFKDTHPSLDQKVLLDLLEEITKTIRSIELSLGSSTYDWLKARVGSTLSISPDGKPRNKYFSFLVENNLLHAWREDATHIHYAVYADGFDEYNRQRPNPLPLRPWQRSSQIK
jgi:hypothetical protein